MVAGRPGNFAPLLRRVVFISESALGGGLDFKSISLCVMGGGNERVTQAIAECDRIDECKSWSDKAAALASYARQADDKTLENYAMRIRSRAIKRAGELLKEFEPQKGGDRKSEEYQTGGAGPLITAKTPPRPPACLNGRRKPPSASPTYPPRNSSGKSKAIRRRL
ncbi:hypothetical protein ACU8NH_18205 [Rhizobium leguminosarum]